eukprot:g1927.t1
MPRLAQAWALQVLLGGAARGAASGSSLSAALVDSRARALQVAALSSEGDSVVNGVLNLFTTEGVAACEASCKGAFAAAFNVTESSVGCVCPEDATARFRGRWRRRNLGEQQYDDGGRANNRRKLRGLAELDAPAAAAFSTRIPGGLAGLATSLELLSESGPGAVASSFGLEESELEISTLTVTPPATGEAGETLTVITDYFDASDIPLLAPAADGDDLAGGSKGVALFLAMLVLLLMTCCCCVCLSLGLLWKTGTGSLGKVVHFNRKAFGMQPAIDGTPRRYIYGDGMGSPDGELPVLSAQDSSYDKKRADGDGVGVGVTHAGDEAGGGGGGRAPVSAASLPNAGEGDGNFARRGVSPGVGAVAGAGAGRIDDNVPRNVSMEESGGTNPLYKSVAPLGTTGSGSQGMETPGRSRLSTFLGNATPSRLRRLAGRMSTKSPGPSGSSQRSSSRHSRSGSSTRSRKHRRQGTFPGAYSQRNSSELDHQRPPADPVYTFMIKTIAAKGFKFMTTTEIAFCAMRMYSHFRRTEGNYKRLTVMQNAENVPPVYEIIWQCDGVSERNPKGDSRFFSSTDGTDAEQQKSLLACLLALSWDGSSSSRKTLRRALTPTRPSKVPAPEDIFWDEFKDNTDALSGDDEMVVVARVVLLVAGSANKPDQDGSSSASGGGGKEDESGGGGSSSSSSIEHGDIMQALSGAHLREVGIAIKEARPGWQEAHVQLVSVLLVIAYLEEGAKNTLPGGKRPDPLSSLEWVTLLTPEALDAFLVEKLEARRALVELDLEPSGLVIKHDDDGEVERVEPAVVADKKPNSGSWIGSRGHQKILPKSSGRPERDRKAKASSSRKHRRNRSTESIGSGNGDAKPYPVVITTVVKGNKSPHSSAAALSAGSAASDSNSQTGGGAGSATGADRNSLRTIAQQRTPGSSGRGSAPGAARRAGAKSSRDADGFGSGGVLPKLTIDADEFAVRVPAQGSSVRNELSRGLSPAGSQTSSVVTRVYAPSSVDDHVTSWAAEGSDGRPSPGNESAMSQVSIAASRFLSSPTNAFGAQYRGRSASSGIGGGGGSGKAAAAAAASSTGLTAANGDDVNSTSGGRGGAAAMTAAGSGSGVVPVGAAGAEMGFSQDLTGMAEDRARSPSNFSEAGPSEAGYSDAASRYEGTPAFSQGPRSSGIGIARGSNNPSSGLMLEPPTPNSAAGSRFDTSSPGSAMTFTSRVGIGSPTAGTGGMGAGGGGGGPLTGRSMASSMRSDGGSSFFHAGGGSQRSGDSRGNVTVGAASVTSWDEEDLQNMGTRWLADRAYNQQFDEHK